MNKDSDDGFIYCNDDMQTVSQRPDRQSYAPTVFPAKVSLTFKTMKRSRVSSFRYRSPLICSLQEHPSWLCCFREFNIENENLFRHMSTAIIAVETPK